MRLISKTFVTAWTRALDNPKIQSKKWWCVFILHASLLAGAFTVLSSGCLKVDWTLSWSHGMSTNLRQTGSKHGQENAWVLIRLGFKDWTNDTHHKRLQFHFFSQEKLLQVQLSQCVQLKMQSHFFAAVLD
jgi:hypothetical protein